MKQIGKNATPIDMLAIVGSSVLVPVQTFSRVAIEQAGKHLSPLAHFLTYNTGDIGNAVLASTFTDLTLRNIKGLDFEKRTLISSAVGILAVAVAELAKLPPGLLSKFLGTPDIADIPAGLAGVGIYAIGALITRKLIGSIPPSEKKETHLIMPFLNNFDFIFLMLQFPEELPFQSARALLLHRLKYGLPSPQLSCV